MKAATPRERQIERLKRYESRPARVVIALLWIAPIVLVILAFLNLRGALTQAKLADTTPAGLFQLWLNGPLPEATYPGHLVIALERIDDAVLQLTDAPIVSFILVALRGRRKNARELLALLKEHTS